MKLSLPLVALVLAAGYSGFTGACRADVVIVESVDGMAQSAQMTITVGADKVRTDVSAQMSTITDTTTGDVTTLMHPQKSYMVISAAASKAMMAQMKAAMQASGGPSGTPSAPVATGKKDKINGYDAAEYTFSNGNLKATYWISSDFPNAQMVKDALAKLQKGGMADMAKGLTPDPSTFPGVAVKTEVEMNGQKITTQLISAKDQAVDPSTYTVPTGYTEIKMPAMPAAGQ